MKMGGGKGSGRPRVHPRLQERGQGKKTLEGMYDPRKGLPVRQEFKALEFLKKTEE